MTLVQYSTDLAINQYRMRMIKKSLSASLFVEGEAINDLIVFHCTENDIDYSDIFLQLSSLMKLENDFSPIAAEIYNLRNVISHTKPLRMSDLLNLTKAVCFYNQHTETYKELENVMVYLYDLLSELSIGTKHAA